MLCFKSVPLYPVPAKLDLSPFPELSTRTSRRVRSLSLSAHPLTGGFPLPLQVDLVIENLVLQGATLFPSFIDVETTYHTRFSPTKPSAVGAGKSGGRMTVRLEQIQADIRDVNIAFRKKTGCIDLCSGKPASKWKADPIFLLFQLPQDQGLWHGRRSVSFCFACGRHPLTITFRLAVLIGGQGIGVTVILETDPPNSQALFVVHSVKAHVGTLKVAIRHSSHDMTYKLLLPLVTGLIKKNIAHSIENAVRTGLEYVQTQLHSVRQQVKEAGEKPGLSPPTRSPW